MLASTGVLNLIAALLLTASGTPGTSGQQAAGGTRSPHGSLSTPCQNCHTANAWRPIRAVPEFDHNQTKYPLRGLHKSVACTQCHIKMVFTDVGQRCQDCHADIHKRQLGANCEQCHTVKGWQVAMKDIGQHTNRFPLTGAHAAVDCDACHKSAATSQFQTMSTDCYSCHSADYLGATNPKHTPQSFPEQNCSQCHSTDNWLNAKFDHSTTGFPLTGMHTVPPRQCVDCHVGNNFNLTTTACVSCHLKDFQTTNNPPHVADGFSQTCDTCHTTAGWAPATFDHSTTAFPLTGSHTVPPRQCTDCHANNNYTITNTTCISCHQTDFNNATSPVAHAGFPTTCQNCHDTNQWTDGKFDHSSTGFPLTGLHTVPPRQCTDCHVNNNYNLTSTACVTCHLKDYQGTTNPNHAATNISQTCDQCHSTSSWLNATFNHNNTGFPLTGNHTVPPRACTDCHVNNNYNITTTTCISCHQTDYNNATSPVPHTGFPTTCENCHDTNLWTDGTFNHSSTGFALTGMHTVPPRLCTDCHVNNNYNLTSTACVTCHLKDFQGTTNPNHVSANFPQTCDTCHSTSTWLNATFNHNNTGFPLTGNHTVPPRACTDCHVGGNYNITNTTCISCHQTDFNGATSPVPHTGFPTTCELCHDTTLWTDATFNHNNTPFPLTGTHTTTPCASCHVNGNYTSLPTTCVGCHQTDYNNAVTPVNHVAAAFPTTCASCHDTVLWTDGVFNHTSTGFQLTGAHTVPPRLCSDCHVNNNYALNSTLCYSCHATDYAGTTNPAHATAGFPTTCELCHDTTVWTDSTFNHNNTAFPLTGAHTTVQCALCHVNGNYTTLPTTCIGCHQTDYNNTTNPGHSAQPQFFPTASCATCHTTTAWTGATFNHTQYTQFSINHGNAGGVCATCHTNSNDYSVFQCTVCHGGNNAANFHHPNVNGYVYNSTNCYQCHSSGGGG